MVTDAVRALPDGVVRRDDPRARRTRDALEAALANLLERHPLDTISVAELCREAGVHRTTFYAHAGGVHAFALATFSRQLDAASTVDVELSAESVEEVSARYGASLVDLLDLVAAERAGYRALFTSTSRGVFRLALDERLRHRARLSLDVWRELEVPGAPESSADRDEAAAFIAGGLVGVLEAWALGDETETDVASERIGALMPRWWPASTL